MSMGGVCGVAVESDAVRISYFRDGRRIEDSIDAEGAQWLLSGKLVDCGPFDDVVLTGRDSDVVEALLGTLDTGNMSTIRMVDEGAALLAYARSLPELSDARSLLVLDLGRYGTSAFTLDVLAGEVVRSARQSALSGEKLDDIVERVVMAKNILPTARGADAQAEYRAFFRELKELLATSAGVRAPGNGPMLLTRDEFAEAIGSLLIKTLSWAAPTEPDAVLLIGGGARNPLVSELIEQKWTVPLVVPESPESVILEGAALEAEPTAPQMDLDTVLGRPYDAPPHTPAPDDEFEAEELETEAFEAEEPADELEAEAEEPADEDFAVEDFAVEDFAVEEPATEKFAVEDLAVEKLAVEELATEQFESEDSEAPTEQIRVIAPTAHLETEPKRETAPELWGAPKFAPQQDSWVAPKYAPQQESRVAPEFAPEPRVAPEAPRQSEQRFAPEFAVPFERRGVPAFLPKTKPSARGINRLVPPGMRWSLRDASALLAVAAVVLLVWSVVYLRGDTPPPPGIGVDPAGVSTGEPSDIPQMPVPVAPAPVLPPAELIPEQTEDFGGSGTDEFGTDGSGADEFGNGQFDTDGSRNFGTDDSGIEDESFDTGAQSETGDSDFAELPNVGVDQSFETGIDAGN